MGIESEMIALSGQFCVSLHIEHAKRCRRVLNYRNTSGSPDENKQTSIKDFFLDKRMENSVKKS